MDFRGRNVVVTGGAGALGTEVVRALLEAGAVCHVPCRTREEAKAFRHRENPGVRVSAPVDLTDEAALEKLYGGIPNLWASLHIAGGFAPLGLLCRGRCEATCASSRFALVEHGPFGEVFFVSSA